MPSTIKEASSSDGASGRSKRKVAQAEVNGHKRNIVLSKPPLKGLKLEGPAELPATYTHDGLRLQVLLNQESPQAFVKLFEVMESVIGEDGSEAIRDAIAKKAKTDPGIDLYVEVLNDISSAYGITQGE